MSTIALPQSEAAAAAGPPRRRFSPWKTWGVLLLAPYVVVFLVFVVYPVVYGLWLARHPESYVQLFDDRNNTCLLTVSSLHEDVRQRLGETKGKTAVGTLVTRIFAFRKNPELFSRRSSSRAGRR